MKLKKGDTVEVTSGGNTHYGRRGVVTRVQGDLIHVTLRGNGYTQSFWNTALSKIDPPRFGDLVQVLSSGRWEAQEGHIISINESSYGEPTLYIVDLEEPVGFEAVGLKVIESFPPVPEKIVREEGKEINPKHLEKGDTIRVVITRQPKDGVSEVLTAEGVYDYSNGYGTLFTKDYGVLMNSHDAQKSVSTVITLLKKANAILDKLNSLKPESIISWVNGGRKVALKLEDGDWTVSWNTSCSVFTVDQVRRFISGAGDSYEILKEGEN